jgi:hypothetical protein
MLLIFMCLLPDQVEVEDPEKYRFDGECLAKAEEMGHPGIVDIVQKQVQTFNLKVRQIQHVHKVQTGSAITLVLRHISGLMKDAAFIDGCQSGSLIGVKLLH